MCIRDRPLPVHVFHVRPESAQQGSRMTAAHQPKPARASAMAIMEGRRAQHSAPSLQARTCICACPLS
eukprot:7199580-Alexandrium_andersonii.AAC.1